ncbi:MAG: hypothetical protein PWP67_919 [Clostridium butyricum]|nr:hypothetical protein [Clostridium butyricum]MDN5317101.1 hypothetical protein [Thermoanaerobacterium sp.]
MPGLHKALNMIREKDITKRSGSKLIALVDKSVSERR